MVAQWSMYLPGKGNFLPVSSSLLLHRPSLFWRCFDMSSHEDTQTENDGTLDQQLEACRSMPQHAAASQNFLGDRWCLLMCHREAGYMGTSMTMYREPAQPTNHLRHFVISSCYHLPPPPSPLLDPSMATPPPPTQGLCLKGVGHPLPSQRSSYNSTRGHVHNPNPPPAFPTASDCPPPPHHGTANPWSSQTGQVIQGLR